MSNESQPNNVEAIRMDGQNIAGVDKYFAGLATLQVAGNTVTPAAIKAVFQADIDATSAVDATAAQLKQQRLAQKQARKRALAMRKDLNAYILGHYGAAAVQMLQDFGLPVPKPRGVMPVASKVQAIAKAKATREARHTMGKRQRAQIKGTVAQPASK